MNVRSAPLDPRLEPGLLRQLIEMRAGEKDREVNARLLKELLLAYSQAERKLVELNQLKNKFLGMAAHDLRNPLASVQGFAELMLNGALGEFSAQQREFLEMMHTASQDMLRLVNDLLDVSIIESGNLNLEKKPTDLKGLVEKRLRFSQAVAAAKGIELASQLDQAPPVMLDAGRIGQVVDNLLSNAIKFSPAGTRVLVRLEREKGWASVSVSDQEPGLSEEDQAGLFGEFKKLSARPTGGESSTGLGLAIVKKILTAHQGRIGVASRQGQGAVFTFSLPLEKTNESSS